MQKNAHVVKLVVGQHAVMMNNQHVVELVG